MVRLGDVFRIFASTLQRVLSYGQILYAGNVTAGFGLVVSIGELVCAGLE